VPERTLTLTVREISNHVFLWRVPDRP